MIASYTLEEAGTISDWALFFQFLRTFPERFEPVLVKISPALDESSQLQYLKKTRILDLASIVSDDCRHSPFGLIIHTDPSGISPTDMNLQYPNLFERRRDCQSEKKSFGNVSLTKKNQWKEHPLSIGLDTVFKVPNISN